VMQALGAHLREVRLRQGVELRDVEQHIKVRTKYLRALEWERFDLIPDKATARWALRAYAASLKLDADTFVRELEARLRNDETVGQGCPKRRLVRDNLVMIPVVAAAIAFPVVVGLQGRSGAPSVSREPAAPQIPAPRPERARQTKAAIGSSVAGSAGVRTARRGALPAHQRARQAKAAIGSSVAGSAGVRTARRGALPAHRSEPRGVASLWVKASAGDSWLEVRAGSERGPVLYAGTLGRGQTVSFRRPRLWVRLGAASNVDVMADGRRPTRRLFGTLDAVITPGGFQQVPLALNQ
jgi:hypothetical protein